MFGERDVLRDGRAPCRAHGVIERLLILNHPRSAHVPAPGSNIMQILSRNPEAISRFLTHHAESSVRELGVLDEVDVLPFQFIPNFG